MVTTRSQAKASPDRHSHRTDQVQRFSLREISMHSSPGDCWVIVRQKVYNVTEWVPKHPGGDLIFVKAGQDCTQLFDSYHPLSARCVARGCAYETRC
jgi:acyl-lipid (8-3)-desaturase